MAVLDYPRHFALLVGATVILALGLSTQPVWAPALLQLDMAHTVFVALGLASAFGAVSCWLLVRRLWAPFLSHGRLILTVAACEIVMIITALATTVVPVPRGPRAPALWWLGFSVSLCIATACVPLFR
jgi:hypothetical protein